MAGWHWPPSCRRRIARSHHDLTYTYNPASQIVSATRSNDLYSWTGHGSGTTVSTADGRNRLDYHAGIVPAYDPRGNLVADGIFNYTYTSENLLTSYSTTGTLEYDPLLRFYKNYSTYFVHDSAGSGMLLGEYYNGNVAARFIPGPGVDEPLVSVDKFGNRSWHHADERGSVIASSNAAGANSRITTYDEYGKSGPGGLASRFGYTGQVHLFADIYDYKARNYNPRLGRFLQTDPIGYVIEKHHQTGKKIIKKAPPDFPWDKFKIFPPLFMFPPHFYNRCSMIAFPDCPKLSA